MRIVFTRHALRKFKFLKELGWNFSEGSIRQVILAPDDLSKNEGRGAIVATRKINTNHSLRVVYSKSRDIMTVITFYPIRKGRYDEK